MNRIIAIDFGTKRCGIAQTDPLQIIASGLCTVPTHEVMSYLKAYLSNEAVSTIVVGEPKQMDNSPSESAPYVEAFVRELAGAFPTISIVRQDERFTSKMAFDTMINSGLKKKKRQNKALIDEISATIILQDYLKRIQ